MMIFCLQKLIFQFSFVMKKENRVKMVNLHPLKISKSCHILGQSTFFAVVVAVALMLVYRIISVLIQGLYESHVNPLC